MTPTNRITSYKEFWPYYLSEHRKPLTRKLHVVGTLLALLCVGVGISTHQSIFYFLAPIVGYGFAWFSHFTIEKNKPATFQYPLWSFISDFKMLYCYFFAPGIIERDLPKAV
jgi:hypothetical protein